MLSKYRLSEISEWISSVPPFCRRETDVEEKVTCTDARGQLLGAETQALPT